MKRTEPEPNQRDSPVGAARARSSPPSATGQREITEPSAPRGVGGPALRPPREPAPRGASADSSRLELVFDPESGELLTRVRGLWTPIVVRGLPAGDVQVGRILIEFLPALEFLRSLETGRLFRTAYRLRSACARPLVLVEGDPYRCVPRERAAGLRGAILSLLTGFGIPVLRTHDGGDSARILARIARQESRRSERRQRRAARKEASLAQGGPLEREAREALERLSALPGLGPHRGRALLERFGSLERLRSASWSELRQTPGVGGATAARLMEAFRSTELAPEPPEERQVGQAGEGLGV